MNSTAHYRHLRRNFLLLVVDYIAFGVAYSLIGANSAMVPTFISHLTDSKQIIGLAGALYSFSWLMPQLFLAQIVNRGTRRKPFMRPVVFVRLSIVVIAMAIGALGPSDPTATLLIFFAGYCVFAAGDALIALAWGDLLGTSVPANLRGVMFAIGQFGVAIGALGMSLLSRWALGSLPFPTNYALLFGVAGVLFVIGGVGLSLMVEEESPHPIEPGPRLREYVPYLGSVLHRDREFLRFVRMRLFFDLALMSEPFYVVFGIGVLGLHNEIIVSDSIILIQLGSALASVLMGWLSRRSGSRAVLLLAGTFMILEPSLALTSYLTRSSAILYGTFFMLGAFGALATPTYFDWIITHAPVARRPIYIGLTNTISAVSNLGPFVGGTILQITAYPVLARAAELLPSYLGVPHVELTVYPALFCTSITLAVGGLLSAFKLSEPRRKVENATPEVATAEAAT